MFKNLFPLSLLLKAFFRSTKKYYEAKTDPSEPLYSVGGFIDQGNKDKPTYVLVKINHGFGRPFRVKLDELVYRRRDKLFEFSQEEIVQLTTMAATGKEAVTITTYIGGKLIIPLSALFAVALVAANIQSSKVINFFGFYLGGGIFSFATVMILGNIITEVYGYKTSRIVVWGAFFASLFLLLGNYVCLILKPAPMWPHQQAYETVLGIVPRFVCASLLAYCLGEFVNSLIIAKMKIADKGEKLWKRIIVSSIIAITVDTMIFSMIAYAEYFSNPLDLFLMGLRGYLKKMTFEFLVLPFTCMAIFYLKEYEKMDIFDFKTKFTPFSFDVKYPESENFFSKRKSLKLS